MLLTGDVRATQFPEASNDRTYILDGLQFNGDPNEIPIGRFTAPFEETTVAPSRTRPGRRYKRDCLPGFIPASAVTAAISSDLSAVPFITTNPDKSVNTLHVTATTNTAADSNDIPSTLPVTATNTGGGPIQGASNQLEGATTPSSLPVAPTLLPVVGAPRPTTTTTSSVPEIPAGNNTPSVLPVTATSTAGGPIQGTSHQLDGVATPSSIPDAPTTTTPSVPEIPAGNDIPSVLPVTATSTGGGPIQGTSHQLDGVATPSSIPDAPTTTTPSVPEIPAGNDIPSVLPVTATSTGGGPIQGTSHQLDGVATPSSIPDAPTTTTPSVPEIPAGNDIPSVLPVTATSTGGGPIQGTSRQLDGVPTPSSIPDAPSSPPVAGPPPSPPTTKTSSVPEIPTNLHVTETQTQGAGTTTTNDPQVTVVHPITTSTSKTPPPTPSVPTPTVLTVFATTGPTPSSHAADPQVPTHSGEGVAIVPTTTSAAGAPQAAANQNGVLTPSSEHDNVKPTPSSGIANAANAPITPSSEHVAPTTTSIAPSNLHTTGDIGTTTAHTTSTLTTDPVVMSSAKFLARQVTMDDGEVCVPILEVDPTEDQTTASATPVTFLQTVSGVIQTVVTTETPTPIPSPFTSVFLTSISGNLETVITVVTPTAPISQNRQDPVTSTFLTSISGTLQTVVTVVTTSPTPTSFTIITFVTSISGSPQTVVTAIPALGQAANPTFSVSSTTTRTRITILLDWPSSPTAPSLQTSGGGYSIAKNREKLSIWIEVLCGFIVIGMTLI